jgi:excisionase family DNA binding protein
MAMLERPHWLTVKEVAHLLDLHEVSVRRKIARGEIPGVFQLGGPGCAVRILQDELERWLQAPADPRPVHPTQPAVDSPAHAGEEQ